MGVIAGKRGDIYLTDSSTAGTAFTDEATTALSLYPANTAFKINNALKSYWTYGSVTVKVGGSAVTGGFQINHAAGTVVFATAPGGVVTVSGQYLSVSKLAEGHEWSLNVSTNIDECTEFNSDWKEFIYTIREGNGSLARCWADPYFANLTSGRVLMVLYADWPNNVRLAFDAVISSDQIKAAVSSKIEESINFTVDGPITFLPSTVA